jgi:hypothetical protein
MMKGGIEMQGDREVRDNRFLGDLLRRWHAVVGSREVTVAQISARLGLTIDTNVRLGHGLRSAQGQVVDGYRIVRCGMRGSVRRWRVERERVVS